jgi:MscS family membrane protein
MFSEWFTLNPLAHGAFLLLFGAALGYFLHLILTRMSRRAICVPSSVAASSAFQRIMLPLALTVMAIFADDVIELAGWKSHFWWDESLSAFQSLPVIAWTWFLVAISRSYFGRLSNHHTEEANVVHSLALVSNLVTVLLIIGGCFLLLQIWSIDLSPLLASAGLVTAISALAARDALSDFFGGITIFLDRPYHIGDFVVLNTGERGEVVSIGIRSTRIRTRDDVFVSVPNSVMVSAKINNESSFLPQYRVRCRLGVAYNSDLSEVERVLLDSVKANPHILGDPEPRVRFRAFSDWSIEVELLVWIKDPRDRGLVRDEMIRSIQQAAREGKINIPYPHHDLTLKTTDFNENPGADK